MHEHILLDERIFRLALEKQLPKDIPVPMEADDPIRLDNIGSDGRRVVRILQDECINLERVIIAHAQWCLANTNLKTLVLNPDSWRLTLNYAGELLDLGANLSIDTFGHYLRCRVNRIG
jgi:predicted metal-dependent phosphotriesterase family hydrolase